MPRLRPRVLLALSAVPALVAVLVAADWWFCLPEGSTATYVGRDSCVDCHQEEVETWTGSDHDLAMDRATEDTVLGDFNDRHFTHVGFDDVLKLSDRDVRTLAANSQDVNWAVALDGATDELKQKVLRNMSEAQRAGVLEAGERLGPVRPCDATDVQQQLDDVMRRLKDSGQITIDFGVTSRFFRRDGKFFVTTDNREGEMETFEVKYVFGVRPLQQYLVEFPDGRIQCLPLTWDTERNEWYHLYPKEQIPHDDQLHWTRPLQNWNYMCAECHTTNLQKNYNLAENAYHTTWSEIDVSCETCHGPGSMHVELAKSNRIFWDRRYGYGLPKLKDDNPRVEIETCVPCHSRRRVVYPGHRPGKPFLDYYVPEMLDGNLYYADGQVLDEDYVYGSFLQSRMYHNEVRCSDCHDPHSVKVKFQDNRLCGQCHEPAVYDTVQHHHHPDATQPGTLCVECHMPETKYMVADPRRDHSIRIPRPDLTIDLDIPNACNGCHADQTAEWSEQYVGQWYGERTGPRHFAYAIAGGREGKPEAERELSLVVNRADTRAIVRASAILLLAQYASGPFHAFEGLKDPNGLVRTASVRALQQLPADQLHARLTPLLADPLRAVRTEAARLLAGVPRRTFAPGELQRFDGALAEYMTGQKALDDQPAAHLNMAVVYTNLGQLDRAKAAYGRALHIDPGFVPVRINLAMLADQMGDKAEAEKQFRKIIELEPNLEEIHYSLGLLLAEDPTRLEEATGFLANAARLSDDNPRIHYNYGLALRNLGRLDEAEAALETACRLAKGTPDYPDCLHALADMYAKQGRWELALKYAEEMVRAQPGHPQYQSFLEYLKQAAQNANPADNSP